MITNASDSIPPKGSEPRHSGSTPVTEQSGPISYNPLPRGYHGKSIWSSRAVEERIEKSTAGSPTVYCGTSGFGKLKLQRASYIVSLGSQADQSRTEKAMGDSSKGVETQANDLSRRSKENRSGAAGTLGES